MELAYQSRVRTYRASRSSLTTLRLRLHHQRHRPHPGAPHRQRVTNAMQTVPIVSIVATQVRRKHSARQTTAAGNRRATGRLGALPNPGPHPLARPSPRAPDMASAVMAPRAPATPVSRPARAFPTRRIALLPFPPTSTTAADVVSNAPVATVSSPPPARAGRARSAAPRATHSALGPASKVFFLSCSLHLFPGVSNWKC